MQVLKILNASCIGKVQTSSPGSQRAVLRTLQLIGKRKILKSYHVCHNYIGYTIKIVPPYTYVSGYIF